MKALKLFIIVAAAALTVFITGETAAALKEAEALRDEVFRLHVVAASDGKEDQAVKLLVRDAILKATADVFAKAGDASEAAALAEENRELIEKTANETLSENGFSYRASVTVAKRYFPTRYYSDDVALPAGEYNALCVDLGEAAGKNWWCVLFPQLCLSASIDKNSVITDEALSSPAKDLASRGSGGARIRFKIVEIISGWFGK